MNANRNIHQGKRKSNSSPWQKLSLSWNIPSCLQTGDPILHITVTYPILLPQTLHSSHTYKTSEITRKVRSHNLQNSPCISPYCAGSNKSLAIWRLLGTQMLPAAAVTQPPQSAKSKIAQNRPTQKKCPLRYGSGLSTTNWYQQKMWVYYQFSQVQQVKKKSRYAHEDHERSWQHELKKITKKILTARRMITLGESGVIWTTF